MIQSRYGWTDQYILYDLPYSRFLAIAEVVANAVMEEQQQALRNVAFGGWQNYLVISQALGGKKGKKPKSFKDWMRDFGLLPGQKKMSEGEQKDFADKAKKMAEETLKAFGGGETSGD